jgi:hypothetical protein
MSRRISVLCVASVIAMALWGVASASAYTWHTNGSATGTVATATGGASQLRVDSTAGVQGITCTQSSLHLTVLGIMVNTDTITIFLLTFGGTCTVAGQTAAVKCTQDTGMLNGVSYSAPTTTGTGTGIHCVIVKTNGACGNATTFTGGGITVTGSVTGTYGNTTQQLTVNTAGQNLNTSWSSTGCLQGTGTGTAKGTFSNASGTNLVYNSTSTYRAQISFTP